MAEVAPPIEGSKKRKRTGKQREEAKRAAIEAALQAEAAAASGDAPDAAEDVPAGDETNAEPKATAAEPATPAVDFDTIAKRIPAALKKLHPVFKHAKTAETMRLIKKIRFLKTKEATSELADLEAQLKLLAAVDLHALTATHLRQKLKKHHTLKHVELPDAVAELLPVLPSVPASSSAATPALISKAENRLCSAKNVADAIKTAVPWVLSEAGATLNFAKKEAPKAKKARAKSVEESSGDEGDVEGGEGDEGEDDDELRPVAALDSDDEAVIEDKAADEAGWESGSLGGGGSDDDDDSGSDDDGAGWESGSVASYAGMIAPPSDTDSDSAPPPSKKAKAAAPAPKATAEKGKAGKQGKADGSSSMFLPSLAAGFTPGDGDSDPDMDYDEDGVIGTKKAERKNRRGQRARQAIWEKKYGKGAKHVVRAREEAKQTDEAKRARQEKKWANQAGFMGPSRWKAPAPESAPAPAAAPPASRPAASRPPPPKPAAKDASLHPSWEAARLRKQKETQGLPANAPKPTKIVFD